ncbi:MAG: class I tRNA ligase family protein, partial [Candidatus Methanomethylophilaceae archaeon]|nr:class I tRNA ligase family protein [Candidatus Methanomethylophilaceae archaeon]
ELKEGEGYTEGMNPHRPWIDGVTFKCSCGRVMRRVPDVLDVWFDSGVSAWAQLGYPHRKDEFDKWWPPRFIVEAHDQTRGGFYSQLGAGCISMDRAPYDEVMMHGWVLDPKGQ